METFLWRHSVSEGPRNRVLLSDICSSKISKKGNTNITPGNLKYMSDTNWEGKGGGTFES